MKYIVYAILRSDGIFAEDYNSYVSSGAHFHKAATTNSPDDPNLLKLKERCENEWPQFVFTIVPIQFHTIHNDISVKSTEEPLAILGQGDYEKKINP